MRKHQLASLWAGALLALSLPAMTPAQGLSPLYEFPNVEFTGTTAWPLQASDGNLYVPSTSPDQVLRTPLGGGPTTAIWTNGNPQVNGSRNPAPLIQGRDGNLYGIMSGGGAYGYGTVFQLTLSGQFTVLYSFTGGADGKYPLASLLQASDGNLYGTTSEDNITESTVPAGYPPLAGGTVFEISPGPGGVFSPVGAGGSTFNILYTFSANYFNGTAFEAPLIETTDHNLYGVSQWGGSQIYAPSTYGFIYHLPLGGGPVTIDYDFLAGADGAGPLSIMQASDGNLYGTNWYPCGTIWQFQPGTQNLTTLYNFPQIGNDIASPTRLVEGPSGLLYGTATDGTSNPAVSTIFTLPLGGTNITNLYTFTGGNDGADVYEGLIFGRDGNLYGTTLGGGANGNGTIWEYSFAPTTSLDLSGTVGANGWYTSAVTATLSSDGAETTYYTLDGGAQKTYTGPISIGADGVHTLVYRSVGFGGSIEAAHTATIKEDKTPPVITLSAPTAGTYLLNQSVTCSFSALDATSGLASIAASEANGAILPTDVPGTFTFSVTATDKAGNVATKTVTYKVSYRVELISVSCDDDLIVLAALCDANGNDVSSAGIPVDATGVSVISGGPAGTLGGTSFTFVPLPCVPVYILDTPLRHFKKGSYRLDFTAGSDPVTHTASFSVN